MQHALHSVTVWEVFPRENNKQTFYCVLLELTEYNTMCHILGGMQFSKHTSEKQDTNTQYRELVPQMFTVYSFLD